MLWQRASLHKGMKHWLIMLPACVCFINGVGQTHQSSLALRIGGPTAITGSWHTTLGVSSGVRLYYGTGIGPFGLQLWVNGGTMVGTLTKGLELGLEAPFELSDFNYGIPDTRLVGHVGYYRNVQNTPIDFSFRIHVHSPEYPAVTVLSDHKDVIQWSPSLLIRLSTTSRTPSTRTYSNPLLIAFDGGIGWIRTGVTYSGSLGSASTSGGDSARICAGFAITLQQLSNQARSLNVVTGISLRYRPKWFEHNYYNSSSWQGGSYYVARTGYRTFYPWQIAATVGVRAYSSRIPTSNRLYVQASLEPALQLNAMSTWHYHEYYYLRQNYTAVTITQQDTTVNRETRGGTLGLTPTIGGQIHIAGKRGEIYVRYRLPLISDLPGDVVRENRLDIGIAFEL